MLQLATKIEEVEELWCKQ